jgi:hypothetical protein
MAQNPYALIKVFVGLKTIDARPVAWDKAMAPTTYVTTCTKCAMMVKFAPLQIKEKDGIQYVQCWSCKSIPPDKAPPPTAPSLVDPIETGRLKIPGARRLS